MKHKYEVTDSSTINSLEYDFEKAKLVIEFKAGSKYIYSAVPEDVARELFLAESKGKHFAAHIKDKFVTEKVGATLNKPAAWKAPKAVPAAPVKAYPAPKAQPAAYWPFPLGNKP